MVFDVDPIFMGTEEWYRDVALSRPPRDRPWYHVLVDGQTHTTYVAEPHLAASEDVSPVVHPLLDDLFSGFSDGRYVRRATTN